ncbi:oxidoreductase [Salinicoccus sp. Marseille-QA3877]
MPRELTKDEIKDLALSFGQAARRAREADMDAVEIHGGHGYLFSQFLSPGSNIRNDEYGGSLENRFRFLKETVQAIQEEAGEDFPVIVRLNFGEFVEDGITFDEAVQVSQWLQDMGIVSIRVSGGNLDQSIPAMIPPTDVKKGIFIR